MQSRSMPKNMTYASILCTSRLLYNAGLWHDIPAKMWSRLTDSYLAPLRAARPRPKGEDAVLKDPEVHVLYDTSRMQLCDLLRLRRLRLLARIAQTAPYPALLLMDHLEGSKQVHVERNGRASIEVHC